MGLEISRMPAGGSNASTRSANVFGLIAAALLISLAIMAENRSVIAISHRGEHLQHPENTMPAFQEAFLAGADFIEIDVRTSADGKLVLSHDDSVDRCTNGHGKVAAMTFEQLQTLDAGSKSGSAFAGTRIPTFDQALEFARKSNIGVYVDVKSATSTDLVSHLKKHKMAERVVIYCGMKLAMELLELNPKLKVMPEARTLENAKQLIEQLHPKVMAFDAHDFTPQIIKLVKEAGIQIYVDRLGPADTPEAWQAAINAGADGIQSDKPRELVEFLRAKGYK